MGTACKPCVMAGLSAEEASARTKELLAEEAGNEEEIWWLSFADPDLPKSSQFLGVAIVRAPGFMTAVMKTKRLGINPGGEVRGCTVPDEIASEDFDRLLSKAELETAGYA